jgi:hypothetical protein
MSHTTYEVRVSGLVPDDAISELGDIHVTTTGVSTVLSGEVTDQAALLGLLARLRAMGMDVLEVRRVMVAEQARDDAAPGPFGPDDPAP